MERKINENYVRDIRMLVEGEVEEAEVIMAARGFSKELQAMIQKIGRLSNEQVGPVVDLIRLTYGVDMAVSFQDVVKGEMDGVLETLESAKNILDDVVSDISNGQIPNSGNDMDDFDGEEQLDLDIDDGIDGELDAEIAPEVEAEIGGNLGDEVEDEVADDFEDEFGAEEPLGRGTLESKRIDSMRKIVEMRKALGEARNTILNKK